jgi:hypothetical protein
MVTTAAAGGTYAEGTTVGDFTQPAGGRVVIQRGE